MDSGIQAPNRFESACNAASAGAIPLLLFADTSSWSTTVNAVMSRVGVP